MISKIAIVGAGLIGRFLALDLLKKGYQVTLFERGSFFGTASCGYAAAGMLSPIAEIEEGSGQLAVLGLASLPLWKETFFNLGESFLFRQQGSLVVWHSQDRAERERFIEAIHRSGDYPLLKTIEAQEISTLEPDLSNRFREGFFIEQEGHVDNREALEALGRALNIAQADFRYNEEVQRLDPFTVTCRGEQLSFDAVIDCRGLGAKSDLPDLRGVRGELFIVEAPEVDLRHPVRILHPRYPLYIVPRRNAKYVIGSTMIECDDLGPVSVRSTLELLSAAFSVHPGFGEARILESVTQARPTLPSAFPEVRWKRGLLHINGLFRNGVLVAPKVAELAADFLHNDYKICQKESAFSFLFKEIQR